MALGWAVGFLFGVPRPTSTNASARVNTNLEQISDWLTKILVGVGLTQLQQIPISLRELAGYISKDYGKSGSDVFSLSIVLYFFTTGFLMGYLLTRLALQREFDDAENIQVNTTGPAEIKVTQPAPVREAAATEAEDKAATDKMLEDKHARDKQAPAETVAADGAASDKDAGGKQAAPDIEAADHGAAARDERDADKDAGNNQK